MKVLENVLSGDEVARLNASLAAVAFNDGRRTAGPAARQVKHNEQADGSTADVTALGRMVKMALERHPEFLTLVRPERWSNFIFSRYTSGHRYGLHTDDARMIDEHGWSLRTDLSFTLFLSDPARYEGGELHLVEGTLDRSFKPLAGSVVIYPTGMLHEVAPVTSGIRLACVGWIQSLIRRADQRDLLFDLDCVRRRINEDADRLLLDKAVGNLLRMWAES